MAVRETEDQALQRWHDLELLQKHYVHFEDLVIDVIDGLLGFVTTDIQLDIAHYLNTGPQYRMVQAQRGEAKTTLTAIYAVYRLIHDPATRVLIVSSGTDMAAEISKFIIQIIMGMEELACMRPDTAMGDRASVDAFDLHYSLKGIEKSPSIRCIGITSNMQGKRADILIADDVESSKNSQTRHQADRLKHLTLDFTSICSNGDIIYLGTPQNIDSLYNGLPGRGFGIRIWPGRYPTKKEEEGYGPYLAPIIVQRMQDDPSLRTGGGPTGERGKPVDPVLLNEEALTKKEIDQGAAYFQLQHMLSTTLSDEERFPLKLSNLRIIAFDREERRVPMILNFARTDDSLITVPNDFPTKDRMYRVSSGSDYGQLTGGHMYVDPSGGGKNGDELAYAITGFIGGRVWLYAVGGMPGGMNEPQLNWLTGVAKKWKPSHISVEKNYGNGAFRTVWEPTLIKEHRCGIEDVWEAGQKELRIIDVLEPMMGSGKFAVHEELIMEDYRSLSQYPLDKRSSYSMFWQMSRITRDPKSLIHDDRLDAVAGSARYWVEALAQDEEKAVAKAKAEAYRKMQENPLGDGRMPNGFRPIPMGPNAVSKFVNPLSRLLGR
jgi:hypothetical protein